MESEFYKLYQTYDSPELLKILRRAGDYQPDAVAAAEKVLAERTVSDEEKEQADKYFRDIEAIAKARQQKMDGYKNTVADFLEPVLQPTEEMNPSKWLKFALLSIVIYYTWSFFETIRHFTNVFKYQPHHYFDITDAGALLDLVYVPVLFWLLYKKNRWGWILLFGNNLAVAVGTLMFLAILLLPQYIKDPKGFHDYFSMLSFSTFLGMVFQCGIVCFLWTSPISAYFNITPLIKKRCVIAVSVLLSVLGLVMLCLK